MTDIPQGATHKRTMVNGTVLWYKESSSKSLHLYSTDDDGVGKGWVDSSFRNIQQMQENDRTLHVQTVAQDPESTQGDHGQPDLAILVKSLEWALGEINREPFEWSCEEQADAHQTAVDELLKAKRFLNAPRS